MTSQEWLERARANAEVLRSLIRNYHPGIGRILNDNPPVEITAPGAEAACQVIREKIRREESGKGDPVARFDQELAAGNVQNLGALLNGAWFGVPESTSCWHITGFKEAVELLEDPPDDVGYGEEEQ